MDVYFQDMEDLDNLDLYHSHIHKPLCAVFVIYVFVFIHTSLKMDQSCDYPVDIETTL